MKKSSRRFGLLILILIPSYVGAQGLADVAAKERERRKKSPAPANAKVYTDTDINPTGSAGTSTASGSSSTGEGSSGTWTPPQTESAPNPGAPTRAGAPTNGAGGAQGEAYWRRRAADVRTQIEFAEINLRSVELAANGKASKGTYQPGVKGTVTVRKASGSGVDPGIESARRTLQRAKDAWPALEDEARRAGALPAWLR